MTYEFIAEMVGTGVVGVFTFGGWLACAAIVKADHDERQRRKLVRRAAKLTALRRMGLDARRPLDIQC